MSAGAAMSAAVPASVGVPAPASAPRLPWGAWLLRGLVAGYVGLLVVFPVGALLVRGLAEGPAGFARALADTTARDALWLSAWTAAIATGVNVFAGTAIAWALVRWAFPGRKLLAALVDLPLAVPTLVAGLVLVTLYGPASPVGAELVRLGLPIAFARPGIVVALVFVTLPFVVRAVEPVLAELDPAEDEAARTLGASRFTTFRRVLLPPLLPAIAAGGVQTFARCVAEFGSLVAVSGNIPHRTLTAPVYVLGEVEGGNPGGAAVISCLLLAFALVLNPLSKWLAARAAGGRHG